MAAHCAFTTELQALQIPPLFDVPALHLLAATAASSVAYTRPEGRNGLAGSGIGLTISHVRLLSRQLRRRCRRCVGTQGRREHR